MGKKSKKTKRKSELKIIFFIILVAAALFIVSTYAWFSTQKNVSITNLNGRVEVAEGLEISLDAKQWYNEIVLGNDDGQLNIIKDAYPNHKNISPKEMLPVSTLGTVAAVSGPTAIKDLAMMRGNVTNSIKLNKIVKMNESLALEADPANPNPEGHNSEHSQYPGYFAFDIFLKNSSRLDVSQDILQLNYDSSVTVVGDITGDGEVDGDASVGLQNTVRVAFARYGSIPPDAQGDLVQGTAGVNADQDTILGATGAKSGGDSVYITDVAIWEPNSSDHVQYIVDNNNKITWSSGDTSKYSFSLGDGKTGFKTDTQMPTYALKASAATEGVVINDIYKWDGTETYLDKQVTLQTTKRSASDYRTQERVQNLISTSDPSGNTPFAIAPNCVVRLRVYVWLEGQDVDCINYASHGGGVTVNIGLVKGSNPGDDETTFVE